MDNLNAARVNREHNKELDAIDIEITPYYGCLSDHVLGLDLTYLRARPGRIIYVNGPKRNDDVLLARPTDRPAGD